MENRKIAVLHFRGTNYGHIEENANGELIVTLTAIPVGWTGSMGITLTAKPKGPQAETLFQMME
jgi:hypothetical protein